MRNWMLLLVLFLCLVFAGPTNATKLEITEEGSMWGWLYDIKIGETPYGTLGAGRFNAKVLNDSGDVKIDTFSYCVDIKESFHWDTGFDVNLLPLTDHYRDAAWLVYNYDPLVGINRSALLHDYDKTVVAKALQLAVWNAVYDKFSAGSSNGSVYEAFLKMIVPEDLKGFSGEGFLVAMSAGSQDQLVAAPVPEPATMLMMGIGLLGLGVVGRRRLK